MARPFNTPKPLPSKEELDQMFNYAPDTGVLTWRDRAADAPRSAWWNSRFGGKVAASEHPNSKYLRVMINGAHHFVHRVIWKMATGVEAEFVDHINGDAADNRIANLRDVQFDENLRNKAKYRNNTSGVSGVSFHARDNKWVARIGVSGKQVHLGDFATKEEATAAIRAAHVLLDYHQNHGRSADLEGTI